MTVSFPAGGAAGVYRDWSENNNPASRERQPPKNEIRALLSTYETTISDHDDRITVVEGATGDPEAVAEILDGLTATRDAVDALDANVTPLADSLVSYETIGDPTKATGGTILAGNYTRIIGTAVVGTTGIGEIYIRSQAAVSGKIQFESHPGSTWSVVHQEDFDLVVGDNLFKGADLKSFEGLVVTGLYPGLYFPANTLSASTGADGDSYYKTGLMSGSGNTVSSSTSKIRAYVRLLPTVPVAETVPTLSASVDNLTYDISVQLGGGAISDTGVYVSTTITRFPVWDIPFDGECYEVEFWCASASKGRLVTGKRLPSGQMDIEAEIAVTTTVGYNKVSLPLPVKRGGAVGYDGIDVAYSTGYRSVLYTASKLVAGTPQSASESALRSQFRAKLRTTRRGLSTNRLLFAYKLDDISDFSLVSTWTTSSAGARPSGAGAAPNRLRHRRLTNLDRVETAVDVTLDTTSDIVWLYRYPNETQAYGTILEANFGAGTLKLYRYNGSSYSLDATASLAVTAVAGRTYSLRLRKDRTTTYGYCQDKVTLATSAALSFGPQAGTDVGGRCWGWIGVGAPAGYRPYFSNLTHRTLYDKKVLAVVVGDSNSECVVLKEDSPQRWANQLETAIGRTIAVTARGGANERDMLYRWDTDVWSLDPEVIIPWPGMNDRDVNNLEGIKHRAIDMVALGEAQGARIVWMTVPPSSSGQTFINDWNSFLRSGGLGPTVTIADISQAVSSGNDGVTIDTSKYIPDDFAHLNTATQSLIVNKLLCDAPFLRG